MKHTLPFLTVFICLICPHVSTESDQSADELEISNMESVLTVLQNLTFAQNDVLLQQKLKEEETKNRHKLEDEREEARTQVLEEEQILLSEIRGKLYRQLKAMKKEPSTNTINSPNHLTGKSGPKDCANIYLDGEEDSGVYRIWSAWSSNRSFSVYCDMDTDGGGWTIIHRRGNPGFPKNYFQRPWTDYKQGFGDLSTDFWIGNENIVSLTNQGAYNLRFDLKERQENEFANYDSFWIEDETRKYKVHVDGYNNSTGGSGDIFSSHNEAEFNTFEKYVSLNQSCYTLCVAEQNRRQSYGYGNSDSTATCKKSCELLDCSTSGGNNRGWWYTKDCHIDGKLVLRSQKENQGFQGYEMKIRPVNFLNSKENL